VLHEPIDALARRTNRLANVVLDAVDWNTVDELAAVLACPRGASGSGAERVSACDACAAQQWGYRPAAGGPPAEQQRCRCSDCRTNERCRE
jgi:hypothetical protein